MSITIRPATPDDAAAMGVVHKRCWAQTYRELLPDVPRSVWDATGPEQRQDLWGSNLAQPRPGARIVVAADGDDVVGLAASSAGVTFVPRPREVHVVYLLAAHHGTGAGQALLDAVLHDGEEAFLWVATANERARAFYRRNNFVEDGATDVHHVGEGAALDVVRMVR